MDPSCPAVSLQQRAVAALMVGRFVNLEAMPSWTQLLSGSDAGKDESLTEEECEM